jgi:hypothetical protein
VKAVYDYFVDKTDSKTGKHPFNKITDDMASSMIQALYQGELSDTPVFFLVHSTFDDRWKSQDRQGWSAFVAPLSWDCVHKEGAYRQFTRAFGLKQAGHMYYVSVLISHHFYQSWRAPEQHEPNFPRIHHYNIGFYWWIPSVYRIYGCLEKLK